MKKLLATAALLLLLLPSFGAPYLGVSGFISKSQALDMDRYAIAADFGMQMFKKLAIGFQPGLSKSSYSDVAGDGRSHHSNALILGAYGRVNALHYKRFFVDAKASATLEYDHDLDYRRVTYGLQPSLRVRVVPMLFLTADFGIWGKTLENDSFKPIAKDIYQDDFELGSIMFGVQLAL